MQVDEVELVDVHIAPEGCGWLRVPGHLRSGGLGLGRGGRQIDGREVAPGFAPRLGFRRGHPGNVLLDRLARLPGERSE